LSILSVVYFVFFSINTITYFALVNIQSFLAILFRISKVMEMEEKEPTLMLENGTSDDVSIEFKDASFSWGYRVKENQDKEKIKRQRQRVQVESSDEQILKGLNFKLDKQDLLVVVG
jgi:ABC-type multidrug transport system fused ATPase/permease subunit